MEVLHDPACIQLMSGFIKARPELWNEDYARVNYCRRDLRPRRLFKAVKERTPASSPIQPRLKQLEKSYE